MGILGGGFEVFKKEEKVATVRFTILMKKV
jgi:hypothetical protein